MSCIRNDSSIGIVLLVALVMDNVKLFFFIVVSKKVSVFDLFLANFD